MNNKLYALVKDNEITEYPITEEQIKNRSHLITDYILCNYFDKPEITNLQYLTTKARLSLDKTNQIVIVEYIINDYSLEDLLSIIYKDKNIVYYKDLDQIIVNRILYLILEKINKELDKYANKYYYNTFLEMISFALSENINFNTEARKAIKIRDDIRTSWLTLIDNLTTNIRPFIKNYEEMTRITHIRDGFDFLGWNIRSYDGTLLTKPSKKNVKAFLDDIRETVKANKMAKQVNLISLLNPKIRGWANYHRGAVAKKAFTKVDHEIWDILWQWAKRRHPNKGISWIKKKYFKTERNRTWVFAANSKAKDGETRIMRLVTASDTEIQRHVKIRGEANPFDPKQETYFEDRLGKKMKVSLTGKIKWLKLWWRQDKERPICQEKITEDTGWNVHHILPKSEGGGDNLSNLMMLHPNCHRELHSQRTKTAKPAPQGAFLEA